MNERIFKVIIFILIISFQGIAQNDREHIIKVMREYRSHYNEKGYQHEFVDVVLNPALDKVQRLVCQNNDGELFDCFINTILDSKGSANETPSHVLGRIFICQPHLVVNRLKECYNDVFLVNSLDFGFKSITYKRETQFKNFKSLEKQLENIKGFTPSDAPE